MPTERKIKSVEQVRSLIERCTIAVSADYTGMNVGAMTELRRALRQSGVEFHVVKNRLTYIAADEAGQPLIKEIVQGATGLAFGFEDPVGPAKALTDFIRGRRTPLTVKGGLLDGRLLTAEEVAQLAALPSREQLIAHLMGQLQGPATGLALVLNGPVAGLARVLQRIVDSKEHDDEPSPEAEPESTGPDAGDAADAATGADAKE